MEEIKKIYIIYNALKSESKIKIIAKDGNI